MAGFLAFLSFVGGIVCLFSGMIGPGLALLFLMFVFAAFQD